MKELLHCICDEIMPMVSGCVFDDREVLLMTERGF